jgi:trans-aconitate methyltransferase
MRRVEDLTAARYSELEFNSPLSSARARELVAGLQPLANAAIVDLGCGWAEFLLRILVAEPDARGIGVDRDAGLIARARSNAQARGVSDRLHLECADVTEWSGAADIAVVVGATHAWGGTRATLHAVRSVLRPGGRVLIGEGIWEQPPTPSALAALDAQPDDFTDLAGLVALCRDSGYEVLGVATANQDEWDAFEAGFVAGREKAGENRAEIDKHRDGYLNGYRGILGFAYLTLV